MKPISFALYLAVAAGCTSLPPVKTMLPVVALKAGEPHSSRQNVAIAVRPVAYTELSDNKGLLSKIVWLEIDRGQAAGAHFKSSSSGSGVTRTAVVPVVPLPVFLVRITNHSGKPLDFSNAQLQLVDDKGKHFQLYSDLGAVTGRVQDDITGRYPQMQQQQKEFELIGDVISKLPVLTKKSQLADGADWEGYLFFKMDVHTPAELEKYLQSVGKLTVQLTGIGGDASPTELAFPIEKGSSQLAVTCEGGKPQDFSHCEPQPLEQ